MRKLLISLTIIPLTLLFSVEKIELMAEDLSAKDGNITAKGNVVVHYQNSVIQASSATYDRENHILTLNGERVELMGYSGSKIQSNQITINTENKDICLIGNDQKSYEIVKEIFDECKQSEEMRDALDLVCEVELLSMVVRNKLANTCSFGLRTSYDCFN